MMRKAIAIDFDGCICTDAFPFIGKFLFALHEPAGHHIRCLKGKDGGILLYALADCRIVVPVPIDE